MKPLKIGTRVKHKFTAFEGKIAAVATYENGDVSYGIRAESEDKTKFVELVWLSAKDVEVLPKTKNK